MLLYQTENAQRYAEMTFPSLHPRHSLAYRRGGDACMLAAVSAPRELDAGSRRRQLASQYYSNAANILEKLWGYAHSETKLMRSLEDWADKEV